MHRALPLLVVLAACGAPPADDADHADTDVTADETDDRDTGDSDVGPGDTDVDTDLGPNHDPACAITAPLADANPEVGAPLQLVAQMSDPDDADPTTLHFAWTSDVDGAIVDGAPNARGVATRVTTALSFGPQVLTLVVTDGRGGTCTADVALQIGTPPVVAIAAPADDAWVAEGADVVFRGNVLDGSTPPAQLLLTWTSDVDGLLSDSSSGLLGVTSFHDGTLSPGDHVITLRATDADGLSSEDSIVLHVDGVPTAPAVTIAPEHPRTLDDLVATMDTPSTDPEGDPISYTWAWTVDGAATAFTDDTVPASATSKGETWELTVTPNDGRFDGVPATVSVVVENTPPVGGSVQGILVDPAAHPGTLVEGPAYTADTLVASVEETATDADGDAVTWVYSWWRNDQVIAGRTDPTLSGDDFAKGDLICVVADPSDGTDVGQAGQDGACITIQNSPPTRPQIEISAAVVVEHTDPLVCSVTTPGTDLDGDVLVAEFEWNVDDHPADASAIFQTDVPGDSVRADALSAGQWWVCSVRMDDGSSVSAPARLEADVIAAP